MRKKCKLSELCDVRDGTHDSPEYVQEGYPLVTSKNIVDGRLDLTVVNYISEKDYHHINERSKVDLGDIIMPMIGTIGNPHLIEAIPEFAIKNVALIKFPKSDVSNKFIYYFLQSDAFKTYVAENNRGGTQKFLSLKDIRNMDIPALSYEKQLEICAVLDKVSELIALRKEQLAKLDQLVKSRFIELFGDRYTNDKKWDNKPLYECADFYNGKAHEQVVDENGEYILVTSRCIASDISDYRRTNALLFPLQVNDIAMVMSDVPNGRALAKCILIDEDGKYTLNQRICCLRNYLFNPIFFYHLLNRHEYFLSFNDGNAQTNLRKDDLLACNIIIPPLELQEQFAAFVKQTDKSKLAIQQSLDKLELLKKSIMQEYFG